MDNDYPLADTPAARMLAEGLTRAKVERGLSMRQIGKQMGYKTSVVLSHMASGRVPIPIDRTEEMAEILKIDKSAFLHSVIKQRHPSVSWHLLSSAEPSGASDPLSQELETILGGPLTNLNKEQRAVIREAAAEPAPRRRWLSLHEISAVETLRQALPNVAIDGATPEELEKLRSIFREV